MHLSDFDYELPRELIAQTPAARRDESRLLVVPPHGPLAHRAFADLPALVPEAALLVVNDARVIAARLFAAKPTGGRVEILLVERLERGGGREVWRCLGRGLRRLRPGTALALAPPRNRPAPAAAPPAVRLLGADDADAARVEIETGGAGDALARLEAWGEMPLPPYIARPAGPTDEDRQRYQTVYAAAPGAVAAPTAGLHFTPEVLAALGRRGVAIAAVTLHVGPGTFAPVREDDVSRHVLHEERYEVPEATVAAHAAARSAGRPVVAVGTTVVRTLESAFDDATGRLRPGAGATRLFIRPGHRFRTLDLLVTNFHLPRSTLLMLVAALAGRERVLAAYAEAVARRYRFFSYGDAMLLHPAAEAAP